jgi:hypothetical protein
MTIDGNYSNLGNETIRALQRINQDSKIESSEIADLRQAANADGTLSEGEAALLQKLELATRDGQTVNQFKVAEFAPNTLQFSALNLQIQDNQGLVQPAPETLNEIASGNVRHSANLMDLGQSIDQARASGKAPPEYFTDLAEQLSHQAQSVQNAAGWARSQQPPTPAMVEHLDKMGQLLGKLAEIQTHWAASIDETRGSQEAAVSAGKLREARALLSQIDPTLLGQETHTRLGQILSAQESLVGRYDQEHEDNFVEIIWPDEDLGQFMMRKSDPSAAALSQTAPLGPPLTEADRMQNAREFNDLTLQVAERQVDAYQNLNALFTPHLGNASDELKAYLRSPSSVAPEDQADVREEFGRLFKDNPQLAQQAAQQFASLRDEFPALRQQLTTQLARAKGHGQTEVVSELEGQLRSLADKESEVVRNWQNDSQLVLEGLTVAATESEAVAQATVTERSWINTTQNRFARTTLEVPQNRDALVQEFNNSLSSEAAAGIREKIEKTARDYGPPVRTVPMTLVSEGTGATMNFNAYVHKDGDEYFALNPMDQKFYRGATPEAALEALGKNSRMLEGQLHFNDGQEMRQFAVHAPEDRSTWDLVMTGVGLVGAGVLICIPTPVTAAGGIALGAAVLGVGASSTYFVAKGAGQMSDLIQNDNFGNNRDTWMAAVDIASGLLGVAGAAGQGARLAAGTTRVGAGTVTGVRSALAQSLQRLASSRGLMAAELADGAVGVGLAAEQIYKIANNNNLSDRQKGLAISQIVMFTATPFLMSGVIARNRAQDLTQPQLQQNHLEYLENLRSLEHTLNTAELPGMGQQVARENITPMLNEMEAYYNSDAMSGNPAMKQEGLARIEALRARLNQLETVRPAPQTSSPQVNQDVANAINASTQQHAQALISSNPPNRLKELAATAQAGIEVNGRTITSPPVENITGLTFRRNSPPIPGLERNTDAGNHRITNVDQYIDFVKQKYREADNPLNPRMEAQLRQHLEDIKAHHNGELPFFDGVPGLHAEVQAANSLLNQLDAMGVDTSSLNLSEIHVATYKLGASNTMDTQGGPFHACTNCTGILDEMTVLTGTRERGAN